MEDLKPGLLSVPPEPLVCPCLTPMEAIRKQDSTLRSFVHEETEAQNDEKLLTSPQW